MPTQADESRMALTKFSTHLSIKLAAVPIRLVEYIVNDSLINLNAMILCNLTEKCANFLQCEIDILDMDAGVERGVSARACMEICHAVNSCSNDTPNQLRIAYFSSVFQISRKTLRKESQTSQEAL